MSNQRFEWEAPIAGYAACLPVVNERLRCTRMSDSSDDAMLFCGIDSTGGNVDDRLVYR